MSELEDRVYIVGRLAFTKLSEGGVRITEWNGIELVFGKNISKDDWAKIKELM